MGSYRNPILPGCHPDPSICRAGDEYYLVTSTFEYLPGLPIHRSRDLVHWELVGHAIHRPDQLDLSAAASSRGLFAPTIRCHDGRFFVVCTVVRGDGDDAPAGHFVVSATRPEGPWSDPIWIGGVTGIDPSLTFDGDRIWLCGTREADAPRWDGQTEVWVVELDPVSFQPVTQPETIWCGALVGAVWAEGPHIRRHPDGGWLLVAAEGGTDRDHAVAVAYADRITGPYRGDPGNPRLTHRHLGESVDIVNIGHADLVDAPDGRTWAVVLGTRIADGRNALMGRQTHLVPVTWEEGRPVFAPGAGRVLHEVTADGVPDQVAAASVVLDTFEAGRLDPAWNGVRWHPVEFADLESRPGRLRLTATDHEPTTVARTAFLGRRLPAADVDIRVVLEPPTARTRAGLLLRTGEAAHLELSIDHEGAARLVLVSDAGRAVLAEQGIDPLRPVELVLQVRGHTADAFAAGIRLGTADLASLATGRPGWFVGSWVGPFAVGEGTVDIDLVELTVLHPERTPA